jgi:hypothetical protein
LTVARLAEDELNSEVAPGSHAGAHKTLARGGGVLTEACFHRVLKGCTGSGSLAGPAYNHDTDRQYRKRQDPDKSVANQFVL